MVEDVDIYCMRFDSINRHIYFIVTRDIPSNWFYINRNNDFQFRKGIFKNRTVKEVFELYKANNNIVSFWEYLQYIYDYDANLKDKRNIYDIWRRIKSNSSKC